MTRRFDAVVRFVGALRCVDVPAAVSKAFGQGRVPVRVSIGKAVGQTSLVPRKDGGHRLFLGAAIRKAAAVEAGDRVRFVIESDPKGGEPDLPPALAAALRRTAGAMEEFLARTPADRRQLVRWVEQPKSDDARSNRVRKAVEMVLRGKPDPKPRRRSS